MNFGLGRWRLVLLPWVAALAVLCWATAGVAHQQGRSFCTVHTVPGGLQLSLETATEHLVPVIALSSQKPSDEELSSAEPRLMQALEDSVQGRTPEGPCRFEPGGMELRDRDGVRTVDASFTLLCPPGPVTLRNTFRLDVDPRSEVLCAIDGAAWVFRVGLEERDVGTPPGLGEVVKSFIGLGAIHVFGGPDHVLFVLALLIAAAKLAREETTRAGIRRMALVVTGFTVGHSVTLLLAGLDVVRVDSRLTESLIALSIIVVGVENAITAVPRHRLLTALAFGLVHGFGFASVLAETELPRRGQTFALVGFNVGIELAQLAIVLVAFPLFAGLSRRTHYDKFVVRPSSAILVLVGAVWLVDRAFALELGV